MKLQKLLKKLDGYLSEDKKKERQEYEELASLLMKLKKKEMELHKDIAKEKVEEERRVFEQELMIVHGQREKGVALLAEMHARKGDKPSQA
ncbi:MAG: hypothetical protein COS82_05490 [Zetaproteobacteria bacterium CG06_land_8_20_14_3_00_59_53]|nr:MAG: hypothetical protein AUK36_02895 [Zetaproteobacteria bacterium CG2_30_59_37]PIO89390.1 MAG: hypothetical protein COX56_08620 [Zetaproteobacteria bacterium CG23_combo_of_CG06-09_8_20_14_all_59_86]PIQ65668.1 MAG: hypothetical protein COV97_03220 [Zetaproteobacteria bacterium CG11_big_fil_rev_8_21_14_0_20_59_439]PIU70685.1 MAG: hypothetical protein COS82_05490 [Zetaproteobacteria bacterium CG06_land_8_20_14_3_00_59_53]PIU98043.1 MAG: hypothetical protein COS62_00080 [Zetaproteobacteria bac